MRNFFGSLLEKKNAKLAYRPLCYRLMQLEACGDAHAYKISIDQI